MTVQKTLTIIGCGNVGKTFGRLWASEKTFLIEDILNRSLESAQLAVTFIDAGRAISSYAELRRADLYLIATPDDQIAACCEKLAQSGCLTVDSIVFHCSGALASSTLQAAIQQGASVASIHPIRSFASPELVAQNFTGTYCGVEGDPRALAVLNDAYAAIGAQLVPIHAEQKILYHAAAVFASNYLVALLDVAQNMFVQSGVDHDVALKLMAPLVRETMENVFRLGPEVALTGPIARGDMATAERQLLAVSASDKKHGALYEQFMHLTIDLAARRRTGKN